MVFPPVSGGPVDKVLLVNHVNPIQYFRSLLFHPKTLLDWFQWQTTQPGRSAGNKQISVAQTTREKTAADIRQREKSYTFIYIGGCIAYCCPSNTPNAVRKGKRRNIMDQWAEQSDGWLQSRGRCAGETNIIHLHTQPLQLWISLVFKTNDCQFWPRNNNLTKIHHN